MVKGKIFFLMLGGFTLLLSGCAFQGGFRNPEQVGKTTWSERGLASWYGPGFYGRKTASGEIYSGKEMTAAHRTLPFDSRVEVVRRDNGKSIVVRINDRGPWIKGYIIDLSRAAAEKLGLAGTTEVKIRLVE
ncbi:MAG: septal ring lytic transglycosylase RlpA family protein [Candidatus Ratteibacteria bacterium]|jgi:rare lipoprotein A